MSQQTGPSSSSSPSSTSNTSLPLQEPQVRYETLNNRFVRRLKEEPLIPLGMFATLFALVGATIGFYRGDSKTMQHFLRYRVAAQGFTVIAATAVPLYYRANHYVNSKKK
ncbi:7260_t:CDS:2 [Funneliformis caledonium]|uniref:7260_t:CDS:1 n=1 Tax=Funneliformis caledonium TaxID=1117310 RepID=A0A9N8ZXF9_9GLOM|nr:7260_t:CDS:2 [Funneliformis caledonium]